MGVNSRRGRRTCIAGREIRIRDLAAAWT